MNLEELKNSMDSNGYAYFNKDAFFNDATKVCYIPENAEELEDCFTYLDLREQVETWLEGNSDYLSEHNTTVDDLLLNMYENLTWEFPSTYLEGLDY